LKEYEEEFIKKMIAYRNRGVNMGELAREALTSQLGEGPAEILLLSIGRTATNPRLFAMEMTRMFGRGAISIFEPIVETMEEGLKRTAANSTLEAVAAGLTPGGAGYNPEETHLMHNYRNEDEQGNYGDEG
jgi:hypothetical protein